MKVLSTIVWIFWNASYSNTLPKNFSSLLKLTQIPWSMIWKVATRIHRFPYEQPHCRQGEPWLGRPFLEGQVSVSNGKKQEIVFKIPI